jgi:hypothetical protein
LLSYVRESLLNHTIDEPATQRTLVPYGITGSKMCDGCAAEW